MLPIASLLTVALPEDQVSASTAAEEEEEDSPRPRIRWCPSDGPQECSRSSRVGMSVRPPLAVAPEALQVSPAPSGGKLRAEFDASIKTRSA